MKRIRDGFGAIGVVHRRSIALASTALLIATLGGCEGAGVGVSYSSGYYAPYDYDYGYGYDYGPWGPDYYIGPPVIVGGGVVARDHDRDRERRGHPGGGGPRVAPHFRPAPPTRSVPSIPSRSRPR